MTPEELADSLAPDAAGIVTDEARAFLKRCVELRREGRKISCAKAHEALREHYGWPWRDRYTVRTRAIEWFGEWPR